MAGCLPKSGEPVSEPIDPDWTSQPDFPCESGLACNPIRITPTPFVDTRNTKLAPGAGANFYACAPDTDESGPEWFYVIDVTERGLLTAKLDDQPNDDIDIDVHILSETTPDSCLIRDNTAAGWVVGPGSWYITADTWVNSDGEAFPGSFTLTVDFQPLSGGNCAMEDTNLRMYWPDCAPGLDCFTDTHTDGSDYAFLRTPSVGQVVKEAHLVNTDDDFQGGWPNDWYHQIEAHYASSAAASGYAMDRSEPWAPSGEGGSEFGQGSTGAVVPTLDETWYVNMYWRDRPAKGTRMILINPVNGHAVVTSAGYETGPGSNLHIGGATEEVHDVLGTVHLDNVMMGFAVDQSLPLGPINCQ